MSADASRRDKAGLKCHSCCKTGHFQQECTTNTKKIGNAPNAHNIIKPSKKGTASKTKWFSLQNTTPNNDAESKVQAAVTFSQDSPPQQTRGKGHNTNAATREKTSEEVNVSKDELVSFMKRISTLQAQDSATAPSGGDYMAFSFTAVQDHI